MIAQLFSKKGVLRIESNFRKENASKGRTKELNVLNNAQRNMNKALNRFVIPDFKDYENIVLLDNLIKN